MTITISSACKQDSLIIAKLIQELETFYGAPTIETLPQLIEQIHEHIFGNHPKAFVLLARNNDNEVMGIATYSFLWPAYGATCSLFLKELYVRAPYRRQGVAQALIQQLTQKAQENKCSRIEWTTDRNNMQAQHFYEAQGFSIYKDKLFYRLDIH